MRPCQYREEEIRSLLVFAQSLIPQQATNPAHYTYTQCTPGSVLVMSRHQLDTVHVWAFPGSGQSSHRLQCSSGSAETLHTGCCSCASDSSAASVASPPPPPPPSSPFSSPSSSPSSSSPSTSPHFSPPPFLSVSLYMILLFLLLLRLFPLLLLSLLLLLLLRSLLPPPLLLDRSTFSAIPVPRWPQRLW